MKTRISVLIMVFGLFAASCKKSIDNSSLIEHNPAWWRVLAIGKDTSTSTAMKARMETVGLIITEDNKLKAELLSYFNGVYTVRITNKQNHQVELNWGWEGLVIDSITPNNNIMAANEVATFTLSGSAKIGKIKVQARSDFGNSSTLIVNITAEILPITYLENTSQYNPKTGDVIISFRIDDPAQIDVFVIQKLIGTTWTLAYQFDCDKKTALYNIPIWDGIEKK